MTESKGDRIKVLAGVTVVATAIAAVVVVTSRLSEQAIAVLAGAICGVIATLPMSILVLIVAIRQSTRVPRHQKQHQGYPPVVVIPPSQQLPGGQLPHYPTMPPNLTQQPAPRQFTVLGDEYE